MAETGKPANPANTCTPVDDADLRARLTPEQYKVTREHGTERAFTGQFWDHHDKGTYTCVCCGEPLFDSTTKYESGSGWPSYWQPVDPQQVETTVDRSHFMERTEVHCATASTRRRSISARPKTDPPTKSGAPAARRCAP